MSGFSRHYLQNCRPAFQLTFAADPTASLFREQLASICVVFPDSHRKSVRRVLQDQTCSGTVPPQGNGVFNETIFGGGYCFDGRQFCNGRR